jgi:hypothetical protein
MEGAYCFVSCGAFSLFFFPFLSISFITVLRFVSVQFSVHVIQELGIFWASVFLNHSAWWRHCISKVCNFLFWFYRVSNLRFFFEFQTLNLDFWTLLKLLKSVHTPRDGPNAFCIMRWRWAFWGVISRMLCFNEMFGDHIPTGKALGMVAHISHPSNGGSVK